ncbi:hypothetical protein FVEN_g12669 [Fusarium venenatum]|nr:hypothetical protein FVEN_g12669 [Fusarium venenatum]
MATIKNEMMGCFNDFKDSLEPWIAQQMDAAIVNYKNRQKAGKAEFKRSFEAYQRGQRNQGQ